MQFIEIFAILKEAGFVNSQEELEELEMDTLEEWVKRANEIRIDNQKNEILMTAVAAQSDSDGITKTLKSLDRAKRLIRKDDTEWQEENKRDHTKDFDGLFNLLNRNK